MKMLNNIKIKLSKVSQISMVSIALATIAVSTPHVFAADKTNEGANTTSSNEVVTKSKDGVEVHSLREPKSLAKSDREYKK